MSDQKADKHNQSKNQDIERLKKEIEEIKRQAEDFKNKYLRALADYQNFENRVREEKIRIQEMTTKDIVLGFLPFLDHLEKAEIFVKDPGLKIVKESFEKKLRDLGVEEMKIEGKEFDPHLAEAIELEKGNSDNIIRKVLRKGYVLGGKVLRAAQVRVSKKT